MAVLGALGDLVLSLSADTARFQSDLGKAQREAEKFGKEVGRSLTKLAGVLVALGGATGFGALVRGQIDAADQAGKLAQKVGIAVDQLSRYQVAAKFADVENSQLQTGLQQLAKNQADFVAGTGEAAEAFRALGISEKEVANLHGDTAKLFELVSGKLASFQDGANKTALAMRIFGRSGSELIPLINSMDELKGKADELGLVIDSNTAKAADQFNDAMDSIGMSIQAIGLSIAKDLLPMLNAMAEAFASSAKSTGEFNANGQILKTILETLIIVGANVKFVFETLGLEAFRLLSAIGALARLDFGEAKFVWAEIGKAIEQSRKELDAFEKRILGLGTANTVLNATGEAIEKKIAPALANTAKAAKEAKDALDDYIKAFEFVEQIQKEANEATNEYFRKQGELHAKAAEDVQRMWQQVFETIDQANQGAIDQGEIESSGPSHTDKLEELRQMLMTEEELEIEQHAKKLERLAEFTEQELEALGGRHEVETQMEQDHQERLLQIRGKALTTLNRFTKAGWQQQAKTIFGELETITAGVAQHDRKLFELNKAAGIATAIIKAYEGISRTLGAYPYPINIAMAAAHGIAAFAQVSAIKSASFSGGGGVAPSLSGGTAAVPVSPVQQEQRPQQTTVINLKGSDRDSISLRDARSLLKAIEEATRDGGRVVLA
jgi:enamine deaminase RidA (YjgF/YER057c/UK114 family)